MKIEKLSLDELEKQSLAAFRDGRLVDAVNFGGQALKLAPTNDLCRMRYAYFIEGVKIHEFAPDIKIALTTCLKGENIEHQRLWRAWSALLLNGPMYAFLFDETIDRQKYWKNIDSLLNDDFFQYGLRRLLFANIKIEQAIKRLRRFLLDAAPNDKMLRGKHLPLLAALGIQGFFNEYVWSITTEEEETLDALALDAPSQVAIYAAYRPLAQHARAREWHTLYSKGPLEALVNLHIGDALKEDEIKLSLREISPIAETTSRAVQTMYEENPYPRWVSVDRPFNVYPDVTLDWLTAGCGTGRPLSQLCIAFPNVKFTAIDLSRSSLAYATRKTREAGADKIDFYHGDLMDIEKLGKNFDFIESSGVLHHMKDPVAGWKALLACLRPGGRMQIGLYSTAARADVFRVRDYIRTKNYPGTLKGIRQLRDDIMALPPEHPLGEIAKRHDFFATSECRDLMFHIQEATYTIPEIKTMLASLGLTFLSFKLNKREVAAYQKRFPGDALMTNLDNWAILEQEQPLFFAGMYKFFCCRENEAESPLKNLDILEKTGFLRGH